MADFIRETPQQNSLMGLLSSLLNSSTGALKDNTTSRLPLNSRDAMMQQGQQQMAGLLASLIEGTGLPKTAERMAYGEDLTNINKANVPLMKPETMDAALTLSPFSPAIAKTAMRTGVGLQEGFPALRSGLFNQATAEFKRPFTNFPVNIEAVSPKLGQRGEEAFKQALTERMIGPSGAYPMQTLGGRQTTQVPGFGGYINDANQLEANPLRVFEVPNVKNVTTDQGLLGSIANAGSALEQEAMAGVRFLPFTRNTPKDATAMFIAPQKGKMSKTQFDEFVKSLEGKMVVVHDPKRGGAIVLPFEAKPDGEFATALAQAKKTLGSQPKTKYGISDYSKDRFYMNKSKDKDSYMLNDTEIPITQQIPDDARIIREGLKYVEKRMFPESTSGIPGQVKASPIGGVQPWSRGKKYPISTIGREVNGKTMYQPINYSTGEVGKLYPTDRQSMVAEQELWDKWQKFMAMQVGR